MARPLTHNTQFDPQTIFLWEVSFYDDDSNPIDVSAYSFRFSLYSSSNALVWDVINAQFSRPNNYTVKFEKSQADVFSLTPGVYTYTFKVTGVDLVSDEWVNGKIIR